MVVALVTVVAALQLVASVGQPIPATSNGPGGPIAAASPSGAPGSGGPAGSNGPGAGSPQPATSPATGPLATAAPTPTATLPGHPAPAILAVLDTHLEAIRALYGIPGVAATIVFRDGTRWVGAAGLANVAAGIPVSPGTPFAVASVSKTFTAALILEYINEGRLALGDSAATRLGSTPGITIDRRITISELLDHTSGLRDFFLNPKIEPAFAANPDASWTPAQAFGFALPPVAAPGARFLYSNTNYLLLGLIAERTGGKPLSVLLRERFFTPLGMVTASYQGVDRPFVPLARPYRFDTPSPDETPIALPGSTDAVPFRAAVTASGGAGSVAASAPDIATWARALYGGSLLGPTMTALMIADAARTTAIDPRLPYGYGVSVLPFDGHLSVGHSGRYLGARAVVRHFPLDGLTISVLTNQSRVDPGVILVDLLRLGLLAQGDAAPNPGGPVTLPEDPEGGTVVAPAS
jgi:D-alanyl-D-alanine carboxypeptidase